MISIENFWIGSMLLSPPKLSTFTNATGDRGCVEGATRCHGY